MPVYNNNIRLLLYNLRINNCTIMSLKKKISIKRCKVNSWGPISLPKVWRRSWSVGYIHLPYRSRFVVGGCGCRGGVHTRSNHWLKGRCSKGFCHSAEITSKQIDYISGERRQWGGNTRMASQGNISIHLVRHGEGTTIEVVAQDKDSRHTRLPLPMPPRTDGKEPCGRVQTTNGG